MFFKCRNDASVPEAMQSIDYNGVAFRYQFHGIADINISNRLAHEEIGLTISLYLQVRT